MLSNVNLFQRGFFAFFPRGQKCGQSLKEQNYIPQDIYARLIKTILAHCQIHTTN